MLQKDSVKLPLPEMSLRRLLASFLIGALVVLIAAAAEAQQKAKASFVVVVSASNPVNKVTREEVSRIFYKEIPQWSHGEPILPVDQAADSPVRQAFSRAIHGKEVEAIKNYWQRQIFSGDRVPPPELATDQAVLRHVARHPGAIGYVRASTPLKSGVKALKIDGR